MAIVAERMCTMKKSLALITLLLSLSFLTGCFASPMAEQDAYCLEQCTEELPTTVSALWQGDDSYTHETRCACYIEDVQGRRSELLRRFAPGPWLGWD